MFFFKQKTAYELRISDWSSDVCSSDLEGMPSSEPGSPLVVADPPHTRRPCHGGDPAPAHRQPATDVRPAPPPLRATAGCERHGVNRSRSEERRVGKECVSKGRSWWSAYN